MSKPDALDPDALRGLLWEAVAIGDMAALETLCRTHQAAIVQAFPHWRQVPVALRSQREAVDKYVQAMVMVAQLFAQKLENPALLQLLMGSAQDNPAVRWQQLLEKVGSSMDDLRYAECIPLLTDQLIDVRGTSGSAVLAYLPVTYGYLGECYFQNGEPAKALAPTRQACDLVRRAGDREGMAAYLGNLYEIHRYLGQSEPAAQAAEELAEVLDTDKPAEAARYRRQADLVRAGEPLNRVIVNVDGQRHELEEVLAGTPGKLQFAFERNRLTLRPATNWTDQGEKQASLGRFEGALALFRKAAARDPFAPHPHYLAGLTYLFLGRHAEAVESYEKTEELAPAWFHCRSDLWLAQQLRQGTLSQEIFLLWHSVEEGSQRPQEKLLLADNGLCKVPDLALLHLARGKVLKALSQGTQAEAAFRKGLLCVEERDSQTRLLVELASVIADEGEKKRLLNQAVAVNGNLVAVATARVILAFA